MILRPTVYCFILLLALEPSHAGQVAGGFSHSSNKDDVELTRVSTSTASDRFDIEWPYEAEPADVKVKGLFFEHGFGSAPLSLGGSTQKYKYGEIGFQWARKFSERFGLGFRAGLFSYKNETIDNEVTSSTGEITSVYHKEKLIARFNLSRSYLIQESALVYDYSSPLWLVTADLGLQFRTSERWKISQSLRHRWYEDQNQRDDIDFSAMHALSIYPTWLWIGAGYNRVSFKEIKANYWSPSSASSYGFRFDVAAPIGARFTGKLGGQVGRTKESNSDAATGNYVKAALSYGSREDFNCELYFIDSRSTRSSGDWSAQSVGLSLQSLF